MTLCRLIGLLVLDLLLVISTVVPSSAQSFHFNGNRKSKTLPFRYIKNLIIIPLTINEKGPYNFVLDTGIGIMLITDPSLTDSVQIDNLRTIKITGMGEGGDITARVCPSIDVAISHDISGTMSAAILTTDAFNLSAFTGMPVHGLIGYEFFSSFIVKINYLTKTIRLYPHNSKRIREKGDKIPLTIEGRKPYLNALVSTEPGSEFLAKLIIDTGAGHPISIERDSLYTFPVPEPNVRANLGVGLSGAINGHIARIPSVRLGEYELKNVIAAFPDYNDAARKALSANRHGNIGNNILQRFNLVFDYNKKLLYLKRNGQFKEAFEHDMSGMEISLHPPDFKRLYISRIESGSAADDAGLKVHDEILSINLRPVSELSLESIHDMLKSGNKRSLLLRILPAGSKTREMVVITLKRRI